MRRGPYKNSFLWNLNQIDREKIKEAIASSRSMREVCSILNLKMSGSSYPAFKIFISQNKLDVSHFSGQGWLKGKISSSKFAADKILTRGKLRSRFFLKRALEERQRKYECEICHQVPFHCGKELVLPIDHIDGDARNNLESNLRFLCPNCHTQTETWGFKNSRSSNRRK